MCREELAAEVAGRPQPPERMLSGGARAGGPCRRLENGRPACPGGALCANRWPLAGLPTPGTPLHLTGTP